MQLDDDLDVLYVFWRGLFLVRFSSYLLSCQFHWVIKRWEMLAVVFFVTHASNGQSCDCVGKLFFIVVVLCNIVCVLHDKLDAIVEMNWMPH